MFGSLKIAMVAILITGIAGAGMYVMKLRSDNAILKANQVKLESAVADQKQLIENQKKDFEMIKVNQNPKPNIAISYAGEGYAARIQNKVSRIRENFNFGKSINKIKKLAIDFTKQVTQTHGNSSSSSDHWEGKPEETEDAIDDVDGRTKTDDYHEHDDYDDDNPMGFGMDLDTP